MILKQVWTERSDGMFTRSRLSVTSATGSMPTVDSTYPGVARGKGATTYLVCDSVFCNPVMLNLVDFFVRHFVPTVFSFMKCVWTRNESYSFKIKLLNITSAIRYLVWIENNNFLLIYSLLFQLYTFYNSATKSDLEIIFLIMVQFIQATS